MSGGLAFGSELGQGIQAFSTDASENFLQGNPAFASGFTLTSAQRQALVKRGIEAPVFFPKQVHGDKIWEIMDCHEVGCGMREADAVITRLKGVVAAVRTADCVPLFLADAETGVIAAVHAGWKSTRSEIAAKVATRMQRQYGACLARMRAVVAPCIRAASYDVGTEFSEYFPNSVVTIKGRLCLDLAAENLRQLLGVGLSAENIVDCGVDTFAEKRWHSFRRDGAQSGRSLHGIMLMDTCVLR